MPRNARLALSVMLILVGCGDDPPSTVTDLDAETDTTRDTGVDDTDDNDSAQDTRDDADTEVETDTDDTDMGGETGTDDTGTDDSDVVEPGDPTVYLQFGDDLASAVAERVEAHVRAVASRPVEVLAPNAVPARPGPDSLWIALGDTTGRREVIDDDELADAGDEGYRLRSGVWQGISILAADGASVDGDVEPGVAYGAYAALETLGYAFLHPLDPTRPAALPTEAPAADVLTSPRWAVRGLQLHTMHPIELADLLNGWGRNGPDDEVGWNQQLELWTTYLEWSLANGQNHVHWVLLEGDTWLDFASSETRLARLTALVDEGHAFGHRVGVDVPIRLHQQHAWRLITTDDESLDVQLSQLRERVDYLMGAGFDYLATESGTTEFTTPDDERMLAWMDALASYMDETYHSPAYIKIHASTGQDAPHFTDPDTGDPLNFNLLPHYADPRLGVMPHTVEHYALDDPAPTYGNVDFGYMREFLQEEAGSRPTVWHPETAYWVSFDIDVPLFLPVYASRRVHDLRLLAADEDAGHMGRGEQAGSAMDGQITFSSGWEWGYWLQEVVTARAAWDPHPELGDDEALSVLLDPVVRPFGDAAEPLRELLIDTMAMQLETFIEGRVDGVAPDDVVRLNGQAYLQGVDTWDDISDLAGSVPGIHAAMTQPDRLGLMEMRNPLHDPPSYSDDVEPLLAELEARLNALAARYDALADQVPTEALPLYEDLADAARMTALRATQVHGLYDYVDGYWDFDQSWREGRLAEAQAALDQAAVIVAARESAYRVPLDSVAGWRPGPTAYEFRYLWTVHSLFYWWRDETKATETPVSPCWMNTINPVDVGFGEGVWADAGDVAHQLFDETWGVDGLTHCLGAPESEPSYPESGWR